jgi:hypothetical protein
MLSACYVLVFNISDFGLQGDPCCDILQYWARIEVAYCKNVEEFRRLWSDILSQGHDKTAAMWLEYIQWERFAKLIAIVIQTKDHLMFDIHLHVHGSELNGVGTYICFVTCHLVCTRLCLDDFTIHCIICYVHSLLI